MLKRFEVSNYAKFKETLVLDLSRVGGYKFNNECVIGDVLGKIIIYGKNASGKTCIGRALRDIRKIIKDIDYTFDEYFLNASSNEDYAQFKYVFQFGDKEVDYRYKRISENLLLDEEYYINGVKAFGYNYLTRESFIENVDLLGVDVQSANIFINKKDDISITTEIVQVPFLRWINSYTILKECDLLGKMYLFVSRMSLQGVNVFDAVRHKKTDIYTYLSKNNLLQNFESFLGSCGIDVKLRLVTNPTGLPELYVVHDKKMLPFLETASSGTIALTGFFYQFIGRNIKPSLVFFDEFDAFLHYEIADSIVKYFKRNYQDTQVIFTTHDTNLMSNHIMRPDCLFILSSKGYLTALCDATERELREGHNLEKMYISGEFSKYE